MASQSRNKLKHYNYPVFLFLLVFSLIMLFPFAWMILSAFKTSAEVLAYPLVWFPSSYQFDNFTKVFDMVPFGRYYFNTVVTSAAQTVLQIGMSICAAYAFAKLKFPFKRTIYMLIQSAMFVPMSVLVVPIYQMISRSGMTDSYLGIILPQVLGVFTTMMLISFLRLRTAILIVLMIIKILTTKRIARNQKNTIMMLCLMFSILLESSRLFLTFLTPSICLSS